MRCRPAPAPTPTPVSAAGAVAGGAPGRVGPGQPWAGHDAGGGGGRGDAGRAGAESRSDLALWMRQAYRDPNAAWRELEARRHAEGGPLGLERALGHGGPELLGELRGKAGWLASSAAKAERATAQRCGDALPEALKRVREAEEAARRFYVAGVEAQRARDQVEVPGLSPAAWAALRAVEQAGEKVERGLKPGSVWDSLTVRMGPEVAEAWGREVVGRPRGCGGAGGGGGGGQGAAWGGRGAGDARAARAPQGAGQREGVAGLAAIGRVVAASSDGRLALESEERARESQRQSLSPRQGLRPRM